MKSESSKKPFYVYFRILHAYTIIYLKYRVYCCSTARRHVAETRRRDTSRRHVAENKMGAEHSYGKSMLVLRDPNMP